jgi:hypothetical protein
LLCHSELAELIEPENGDIGMRTRTFSMHKDQDIDTRTYSMYKVQDMRNRT